MRRQLDGAAGFLPVGELAPPSPYVRELMYGAASAFNLSHTGFVRRQPPSILAAANGAQHRRLMLDIGDFSGPPEMGEPARARPIKLFNPSIAAAPIGLCPRCAFVAAVRADALHQCDASSPLFRKQQERIGTAAYFKSTALVVLDTRLRLVGWTWFLSQPVRQVATWQPHTRMFVPAGVSDGFAPPWAQQVYDTRLLNLDGRHIFATYNCVACKFSLSLVHLTREVTADGGLRSLRAWTSYRHQAPREDWLQGRNQALFGVPKRQRRPTSSMPSAGEALARGKVGGAAGASPAAEGTPTARRHPAGDAAPALVRPSQLLVQPWIGIVGSFGTPRFSRVTRHCYGPRYDALPISGKHRERFACGPHPANSTVTVDAISNVGLGAAARRLKSYGVKAYGRARLLHAGLGNASRAASACSTASGTHATQRCRTALETVAASVATSSEKGELPRALDAGGARLSATANLVRIAQGPRRNQQSHAAGTAHGGNGDSGAGGDGGGGGSGGGSGDDGRLPSCTAYLGIGHLHRGDGELNARRHGRKARRAATLPSSSAAHAPRGLAFKFGFQYTHFFYTLSPHPPHRLLATSAEFCFAAAQDPRDCESVQFASGLALASSGDGDASFIPVPLGNESAADMASLRLLVSYGVNDCESQLLATPLTRVWSMLRPLLDGGHVCEL